MEILSSPKDMQECKDLHAKNKGLIIITAHAGAWQSAMSSFDFMEGDKYVLYKKTHEDIDKHAHEHGALKQTVKFIDPSFYGGGAVEIMNALEKNAVLCVMGDREFGSPKNRVAVPFLGRDISVPGSIYRIAGAAGAPVAIIFFPFKGMGKLDSVIADTFYVEDRGANIANYKEYALRFGKALENFVKQHPYQYFNFYDVWNLE
jgi:lauroyl/myristoyl acyltransferase